MPVYKQFNHMHIISHTEFKSETLKGGCCLGDIHVEGKIILQWIYCVWDSVGWIQLAQSVMQWQAMNTVMNIQMTSKACSLLTS